MKRPVGTLLIATAIASFLLGVLPVSSYRRALAIDQDVLTRCLDRNRNYKRKMRLQLFDPFVTLVPHWRIYYAEEPAVASYTSPSVAVDLLGRVVDSSSKEVRSELVAQGYVDSY
jgi:hypothetical protein